MKINQIHPMGDRILIEVLDEIKEYSGALTLLEQGKEKSNIAVVLAVPKEYNKESPVKTGDKVIYSKHSGSVFVLDKFDRGAPEYRLISIYDILAQVDDS